MSELIDALRVGEPLVLARLLAEDVRFHSPVADYEGRETVVHLLRTIAGVLDAIEPEERLDAPGVEVTFAKVRIGDRQADAVVREELDREGAIVDLTLMLRPLDVLMSAVERMGQALSSDPLPDSST